MQMSVYKPNHNFRAHICSEIRAAWQLKILFLFAQPCYNTTHLNT